MGGLLQAAPGTTATEEEGGDEEELMGLEAGAVELPVSMGMSSKFAVHTGPEKKVRPALGVDPPKLPNTDIKNWTFAPFT